jgi:hypothetical protein
MRPSLATRLVRTSTRNAASASAAATLKAAPIPATLCHSKLDTHQTVATPIPSRSILSHVWFSSSAPYSLHDSGLEGDHKPTDERTLKLGKSTFPTDWAYLSTFSNNCYNSHSYPSRTPSYSACFAAATRNTFTTNLTTSVSFDTPTSSNRLWKDRLPRCTLDGTCGLGTGACSGQCQAHSHLGTHDPPRWKQCELGFPRREAHSQMEDVWENQKQKLGRHLPWNRSQRASRKNHRCSRRQGKGRRGVLRSLHL